MAQVTEAGQSGAIPADETEADAERITRTGGEILVVATRLVGQVDAAQPPIMTLSEADIASYGAASLGDLLTAIGPQTGSGRGRGGGHPIILLNGQRISNFREMRNFAPEAIRRMEVLPEEVALRYGYPPDARVINFILKDNYSSITLDGEYNLPTNGGFAISEAMVSLMRINKADRLNLNIFTEDTSLLTESERGVLQSPGGAATVAGDPDPAEFRSLIADTRDLGVNGSWSKGLGQGGAGGSISANASYARNDYRSLAGLPSVVLTAPGGQSALRTLPDPLTRISKTDNLAGGGALNLPLDNWLLALTVDAGHTVTNDRIDRRPDLSVLATAAAAGTLAVGGPLPAMTPGITDRSRSVSDSATTLLTLTGRTLSLPAGDVSTTIKAGFAWTRITSSDTRQNTGEISLSRGDASAGINVAVPLTSRRNGVLAGLGDMTLNVSAGINRLSDFGTLSDWSAGLTWAPFEKLSLQASYIVNEAPPTLFDLGGRYVVTPNVPVYDFSRSETVLVSTISGGNRDLSREKIRDLKLSATWELPFLKNSNFIAEYFRNRSSDVIVNFPLLTPAIEAAFPGRVQRGADGRLISIDRRAVLFSNTASSRLRYGINLSGSIGKAAPGGRQGLAGMRMAGPGPGGRGTGSPGGMSPRSGGQGGPRPGMGGGMPPMAAMMGGGGGQGRWNLSVYHTFRFTDEVGIAPGLAPLDLLGGDALSGGGVTRHALEMEGGGFYRGFGLRFNGKWNAPTRLQASGAPGTSDLRFGSVLQLDVRVFSDLGRHERLVKLSPLFKGMRLAFQFDNILDSRQKVTDRNGLVPINYQADFLDPRGRMIGIDIRKSF